MTFSTSASEMSLRTPPSSITACSPARSSTTFAGMARHMSADLLRRDPGLAERDAAIVGGRLARLEHSEPAIGERRAQAPREQRIGEAAAAQGDGAQALARGEF